MYFYLYVVQRSHVYLWFDIYINKKSPVDFFLLRFRFVRLVFFSVYILRFYIYKQIQYTIFSISQVNFPCDLIFSYCQRNTFLHYSIYRGYCMFENIYYLYNMKLLKKKVDPQFPFVSK